MLYVRTFDSDQMQNIEDPGGVFVLVDMEVSGAYGPWRTEIYSLYNTSLLNDGSNIEAYIGSFDPKADLFRWIEEQFQAITRVPLNLTQSLTPPQKALLCSLAAMTIGNGDRVVLTQPENGLPPYMIRGLVQAARTWHGLKSVSIGFISYSPVILSAFTACPENVWLARKGKVSRVADLYERDWLDNFNLGALYMHYFDVT